MTEERRAATDTRTAAPGWAARARAWLRPRRRWCLGTRLVVVATAAWLVFVVLHLVLSGRTPLWGPFSLVPPVLFVAVPVAVAVVAPLARPVRWRVLTVLAVTVVAGAPYSGVNVAAVWHDAPPAPADAVTVVAWNTEFWDQNWRTGDGSTVDTDFYGFLRQFDADVYLLQEYLYRQPAADGYWTPDMAVRVDALPRLRAEFPGYEIVTAGEQITLSRLPVVAHRGLDVTPYVPEQWRQVPPELQDFPDSFRFEVLRTDVQVGDRVVSFYNTHIHEPPRYWRLYEAESRGRNEYNHARREASYRALREDVAANPNPVVIGGDFNTTPAMGVHRLLPDGLVDPTPALSSLYPASWSAGGLRLWRIDWMFTTPDITVHEYEMPDVADLSDHLPQRMVLSVGDAGGLRQRG